MFNPMLLNQYEAMGLYSTRGRCFSFDIGASGYVCGEGISAVALKLLAESVDGKEVIDESLAIDGCIAGCMTAQAGSSASMSAPNGMHEQELIRDTVRAAAIDAQDVDCVSGYGSGAYLADAVEVGSLVRSHRGNNPGAEPLIVRSEKSNAANCLETSGMISFIAVLLSGQWGFATGGIHLRELNPHMDLDGGTPVVLTNEISNLPRNNSFMGVLAHGFGGTSGYCIAWNTVSSAKCQMKPGWSPDHQHVAFWPGGGGFLDQSVRPEKGYYIAGSWMDASTSEPMTSEGDGVYRYTLTLGINRWETFQIWLDGLPNRALNPGRPRAPNRAPVLDCNQEEAEGLTWMIDGRQWYATPTGAGELEDAVRESDGGGEGEAGVRTLAVDTPDSGKPGDQYEIRLRIAGKWRSVEWEKVAETGDGDMSAEDTGKYYIVGSWTDWEFSSMEPDPDEPGIFRADAKLRPFDAGLFQIVRNRDWGQVIYPESSFGDLPEALGPDEWGDGMYFSLGSNGNQTFRIELQRSFTSGADVKKVTWQRLDE